MVLARQKLTNYPNTGPIFSGPHQEFFVCNTIQAGLGEPLVDNQNGEGFRVQNPDGSTAGWSLNCSANTRVDYQYRTTSGTLPAAADRRLASVEHGADHAHSTAAPSTTSCGASAARSTASSTRSRCWRRSASSRATSPDTSLWNKRAIYTFDGGVQIGHRQGTPGGSCAARHRPQQGLRDHPLLRARARARTTTSQLGGETALMTKEEFIERYGVPLYTVGLGGSGGAIQQYVYGQNHERLLDAGIPQYSYPDMVTQTIHVGDCELLEHYMDVTDGVEPEVAELGQPRMARGPERARHAAEPLPRRRARQQRVRARAGAGSRRWR